MTVVATTKIDLLILGLLLDRPMHGYELYQLIQAEEIDTWFNVSMAGVYYSLGKLRDQGLVAESRQGGGRSTRRSIYHLTDEGRAAFFAAMEAQAVRHEMIYLDYDVILYLLNRLPLQRAISLLGQKQAFLDRQVAEVEASLNEKRHNGCSLLKLAILDHRLRSLEMERAWLADVIDAIQGQGEAGADHHGEQPGMMVLSGDLGHYHLPDLIRLIISGQHSGTLSITNGVHLRTISFAEGQPVCATARRQDIPPSPPQSRDDVLAAVYDLFRWQEGSFTLDQEMEEQEWCTPLNLGAEELILRGCRCVDNWAIIQRLIPSADIVYEQGMTSQRLNGLPLEEIELQIVAAVDGIKDLATIARDEGLTVFEASRAFYCLAAVGVVHAADPDKARLRRAFREIAELMCSSTVGLRSSADDRTCEEEVNATIDHLPLCLKRGRIEDQTDPQMKADELVEIYRRFLMAQLNVVGQRFGRDNARQSLDRTLRQLAPELQDAARRYGFFKLLNS